MPLTRERLYQFGEFTVDSDQRVLLRNGTPLPLPPKVFDTLLILIENGGRLVKKQDLMSRVWPDSFVQEANLTVNIQQLRKTLGDNARKPIFIETVARRGYRFIANLDGVATNSLPVSSQINGSFPQSTIAANEVEAQPRIDERHDIKTGTQQQELGVESVPAKSTAHYSKYLAKTFLSLAFGAFALIALSMWFLWPRLFGKTQPYSERLMLAVLPFENLTGDSGQEYFSDGLTEEMITQLGNLDPQHLGVIARTSVMHYKNNQVPLSQIGRELGVQYVLEGSVRRDPDKVRISAQLIQTKDQTNLWAREYDRELSSVLILQAEIGKEIANEIQLALVDHKPPFQPLTPEAYEAYDLYLKGQYFFNQRTTKGFEQAISYFQQATAKDPKYARAYAGLADSYALIGGYSGRPETDFMPKARAAAQRALELDGNLAEAHTALALIVQNYDWDWQTAEKEFRRAIELNPNYATAHHWYAEHLTWLGRFDEALRESERARQLDPLSLIIAADNGATLYYSRQYDRAIAKFLAVREMDPNFSRTGVIRSAYEQKGLFDNSLEEIEKWSRAYGDRPWTWSELAYIYGRSGHQAQAKHALQKLLQFGQHQPVDPAAIAWAYVGVGNKDQAFAYLEKAFSQHSSTLTTLKVEPRFDPLRSDARFQDLLRRVGLAS